MDPTANPDDALELEPIRQALLRESDGNVSLERIDAVLADLLAHEFVDARVASFLPIFLHRAARERLSSPWS